MAQPPFRLGPPWAPGGYRPDGVPPDAPVIAAAQTPLVLPYVGNTGQGIGASNPTTLSFGVNANFGDGVVIAICHATTRTVTVKDNYGSIYTPASPLEIYTNSNYLDLFYCQNLLGTNPSVTITGSGAMGVTYAAWLQIVGASQQWFFDGVANFPHAVTATGANPILRTTSPNDLIVSVCGSATTSLPTFGSNTRTFNFGAPFGATGSPIMGYTLAPQPVNTMAPAWTNPGGNQQAAITMAIRAAGQFPSHIGPPQPLPIQPVWARTAPPGSRIIVPAYFATEVASTGPATINATVGAFTWSGLYSQLFALLSATPGTWSWTGTTATSSQQINSGVGGYSWAGQTATTNDVINGVIGSYSWAGTTATTSSLINETVGTYSWSGTTSILGSGIAGIVGAYTWAGTTCTASQLINEGIGTYSWSGTTAIIPSGGLNQSVGTWDWAGTTAILNTLVLPLFNPLPAGPMILAARIMPYIRCAHIKPAILNANIFAAFGTFPPPGWIFGVSRFGEGNF